MQCVLYTLYMNSQNNFLSVSKCLFCCEGVSEFVPVCQSEFIWAGRRKDTAVTLRRLRHVFSLIMSLIRTLSCTFSWCTKYNTAAVTQVEMVSSRCLTQAFITSQCSLTGASGEEKTLFQRNIISLYVYEITRRALHPFILKR